MGSFGEVALSFTQALHVISPQEWSRSSTLCRKRTECLSSSETTGAISQVADIYRALQML